jgi:hypothetical protein
LRVRGRKIFVFYATLSYTYKGIRRHDGEDRSIIRNVEFTKAITVNL